MANPFVAPSGDPTADLPDPNTFSQLRDQWSTFLEHPMAQAAIINAGINLMQPPSFGDTGASQIGRAIGAGGEAIGRQEAMNIKEQEAQSKEESRRAAADLAGARAANVGTAAELQKEKLQHATTMGQLVAGIKLRGMHSAYEKGVRASNDALAKDVMNPPEGKPGHKGPAPVMPFDQWLQVDPAAKELAVRSGYSLGGTTEPPAPDTTGAPPRVSLPEDARARFKSGTSVTLPDGTIGTVP